MVIKIYLDISDLYHKDVPNEETARRLAHLVKYIIEDGLPLDVIEKAIQSLNWSKETQEIITNAAGLAWNIMQDDIEKHKGITND